MNVTAAYAQDRTILVQCDSWRPGSLSDFDRAEATDALFDVEYAPEDDDLKEAMIAHLAAHRKSSF